MTTITSNILLPNYNPEEVGLKGEKGDDGKTSYLHIAYSNSADGAYEFSTTDPTNRAYTGYYTDFEMIDSTDPSKYTWQRTKGEDGADGQLFTGETEPTDFNEGDIWYKVVSGKVTGVYEAKDGAWVEIPFESSVIAETIIGKTIQASHLTGSTIDGGEINGSVINGGEFNNTFTEPVGTDATLTGNTTIQRGIVETQYNINNNDTDEFLSSGRQTWNGVNVESVQNGADGLAATSSTFGATGIEIYNKELHSQFGRVQLGYQDLMTLPRKEVTHFNVRFKGYPFQPPAARRIMRTVQLYGAFTNLYELSVADAENAIWMGSLPIGYRPPESIRFVMQASGANRYLLDIAPDGGMYVSRMSGWTGSQYNFVKTQAGSWLNIQCNFMAADV